MVTMPKKTGPGKGHGVAEGGAPAAVVGVGADHFGAHGLVDGLELGVVGLAQGEFDFEQRQISGNAMSLQEKRMTKIKNRFHRHVSRCASEVPKLTRPKIGLGT
jgi:hypothetical protein